MTIGQSGTPQKSPAAATAPGATLAISPAMAALFSALLLAILGVVFFFFFQAQVKAAVRSPSDWGHTLVIPLIAGYFVYLKREQLLAQPFKPAWTGLLLMLLGTGIYFVAYLGPKSLIIHHNARGAGVGMTIFGLVLLLFGWRAMRYLWFPVAYLVVFGQTISDGVLKPVTEDLQDISARGAFVVLNVIGIDTEKDGNVLTVWSNSVPKPLNVAEACSGMRMLLAFLALGVAIAHTGLKYWWQQVLLVASGVPVAIGVNVLRVVSLGILSLWDVNFAAGEFHHIIGLIWLLPAFLVYLGILWFLRNLVVEDEPEAPRAASKTTTRSKPKAVRAVSPASSVATRPGGDPGPAAERGDDAV